MEIFIFDPRVMSDNCEMVDNEIKKYGTKISFLEIWKEFWF